ncbi:dihydrodipicolinate synthase family protein [Cronobacter dublinensis]|uniref:dihydrodipicolinate synthase family protein n=1 Tax=Cronobacter dublinensis TaxID=413497 RepID=UPI0024AF6DAB|nr:dihydrodipicolinate synthase family protein [Cronobacter dublinensis]EKM6459166.1 dihydrodipicolinate synthase family protein [Cronobacter dublinensis]EKY3204904.1 dihydrodipicolinate synthase family protein [Cronobacter dublinensis]ELQ6135194.1 dihydrodipicolinate synthase family protein [Cronobacter dublinensis]ELQ6160364.1 dihydrodipicolinate synthase family protein [Cronobacter dublinensis]ELY2819050.1 dihydrodipicolinate synthase family protein [Cronobacter dublinensis]
MFTGLSAFPLTPLVNGQVDETTFVSLIETLAAARVDSVAALGSTGSHAYLSREQRARVTTLAVQAAGDIPVITSIGALRLEEMLDIADDAQRAGVSGLLLAPLSYQPLSQEEAYRLYERVARAVSVPLCIYDNPATTGFTFTPELLQAVARLPNVGSVKRSPSGTTLAQMREEIATLRRDIPATVTIGASADPKAISALLAGADTWYSVVAGLWPHDSRALAQAALSGDEARTAALNASFEPLWALFRHHGGLRVIAAAAELTGRVAAPCLPEPLQSLQGDARAQLQRVLAEHDYR